MWFFFFISTIFFFGVFRHRPHLRPYHHHLIPFSVSFIKSPQIYIHKIPYKHKTKCMKNLHLDSSHRTKLWKRRRIIFQKVRNRQHLRGDRGCQMRESEWMTGEIWTRRRLTVNLHTRLLEKYIYKFPFFLSSHRFLQSVKCPLSCRVC